MPEAAISGLVEGLLQGQAIKAQKKQQAEEKERQHALDIFQQHAQQWREQTQAQQYAADQEQQKTQNALAERQQKGREDEEARKVAADKARQDLLRDSQNAKTEKQKQDLYFKAIGPGMGYTPEQASALTGYTPPAMSAPAAAPQQPGLQNALGILGQAGQSAAPIPQGGIGANAARPDIMSMLQNSPDASGRPDRGFRPGAGPEAGLPIGQSPVAAAKIANQNAGTAQKNAQTQYIGDKEVTETLKQMQLKILTDLEAKKGKKTDAETATINALREGKVNLQNAQVELAKTKADAAIAMTELNQARKQYLPTEESLKADGLRLRQENSDMRRVQIQGSMRERATTAKRIIQGERSKAEQQVGKLDEQKAYWQGIKAINPATVDPEKGQKTLQQIHMAEDVLKGITDQQNALRKHINELSTSGANVDKTLADTTTMINKTGTPDKAATEKARADAAKTAKNPPTMPHVPDPPEHTHLPPPRAAKVKDSGTGKTYKFNRTTGKFEAQ
jgi:hypothetical protein